MVSAEMLNGGAIGTACVSICCVCRPFWLCWPSPLHFAMLGRSDERDTAADEAVVRLIGSKGCFENSRAPMRRVRTVIMRRKEMRKSRMEKTRPRRCSSLLHCFEYVYPRASARHDGHWQPVWVDRTVRTSLMDSGCELPLARSTGASWFHTSRIVRHPASPFRTSIRRTSLPAVNTVFVRVRSHWASQ